MSRLVTLVLCASCMLSCSYFIASGQTDASRVLTRCFGDSVKIHASTLSEDGMKVVVEFDKMIAGISLADGKTLWTRPLQQLQTDRNDIIEWIDTAVVIIPVDSVLEWVEFSTGRTLASVRMQGRGASDLLWSKADDATEGDERVMVYRQGRVMILPSKVGFLVLDLKNRKVLLASDQYIQSARREFWNSTLLYHGDMDTAVVVDAGEPRLLYTHDQRDERIQKTVYQNVIRHGDAMLLFLDLRILCVNTSTGRAVGTIDVIPEDAPGYTPILVNDKLHLLIQSETDIRLVDVITAKTTWSIPGTVEVLGSLMEAWPIGDDLLVTMIDEDDKIDLSRVSKSTGATIWKSPIAHSEGGHFPGHSRSGAKYLRFYTNFRLDTFRLHSYHAQHSYDSLGPYTADQMMSLYSHDLVHEGCRPTTTVRYCSKVGESIFMSIAGRAERAFYFGGAPHWATAEGILRIDWKTGKVIDFKAVPFCKSEKETYYDLHRLGQPITVPGGVLQFGLRTAVFVKDDGTVHTLDFSVRELRAIAVVERGKDYVTISHEDPNESKWLWRVRFSAKGLEKDLIGVTDFGHYFATFSDTTFATVTMRIFEDELFVYPLLHDVPTSWPEPLWKMTEEQLDSLDVWTRYAMAGANDALGIHTYEKKIYFLGTKGLAIADAQTGCRSVQRSYGGGVWMVPNGLFFHGRGDIGAIRETDTCSASTLFYRTKHDAELHATFSEMPWRMVLCDRKLNQLVIVQVAP